MKMKNTEHMHNSDEHSGHMGHMDMSDLKRRFIISLILAVPIILLSPMMGVSLPFQVSFQDSQWVVLVFASILFFYGGKPFLTGAAFEIKEKKPAMMTLIALGITVSYFYSIYAFIINNFIHNTSVGMKMHVMDFFWELATLIVIMLLGHYIEMKSVSAASDAVSSMAKLLPGKVSLVSKNGHTKYVELKDIKIGDIILIKAGEKIGTDGKILKGSTAVNEAMVTGEAKAISKKVGDMVIGGSLNGNGTIFIKVSGTGESGYLAQVMKLVSQAQSDKSKTQTLSDKVAGYLFYIALTVGVLTLIIWSALMSDFNDALSKMVTVLVIACPHALGLAIPLVSARSTSIAAKNGLLIKSRTAFEQSAMADTVFMDKTGTLTEGNFKVLDIISFKDEYSEHDILSIFAALESGSSHPLAEGIINKAKSEKIKIIQAKDITTIAGVGLEGVYQGKNYKVVNGKYLAENKIKYDIEKTAKVQTGSTISFLLGGSTVIGLISQGDKIKKEAVKMVKSLSKMNISVVMLTGDNNEAAKITAKNLGIERYYAELKPEDKEKIIKENTGVTMMVGDGVNDAPALSRADVGVAIGAGTDVANESADVILVRNNPADIVSLFRLAKNTVRKMKENLWWGAGYNIIAIPLAAGILAPVGVVLSPAVGAILMSLSTVIVAVNAMTLRL